jgi:hypothetical protein
MIKKYGKLILLPLLLVLALGLILALAPSREQQIATPQPTQPSQSQPQAQGLIGPACYVDPLNRFSLRLPKGWQADQPPSADADAGLSVFYNFLVGQLKSDNGSIELPENALKVQVAAFDLAADETLEQWVSGARNRLISSDPQTQPGATAGSPYSYRIANFDGLAYYAADASGYKRLLIHLPAGDQRLLVIILSPAQSPAIPQALMMLESLKTSNFESCSTVK